MIDVKVKPSHQRLDNQKLVTRPQPQNRGLQSDMS